MLTDPFGMLPSPPFGAPDVSARRKALCEPVQGSTPDIAGKDVAKQWSGKCLTSRPLYIHGGRMHQPNDA